MTDSENLESLKRDVDFWKKSSDHWRANHADMVAKNARLLDVSAANLAKFWHLMDHHTEGGWVPWCKLEEEVIQRKIRDARASLLLEIGE